VQFVEYKRQAPASHIITLTQLQSAANVADHQIAPSCITPDNEAKFDLSDEETLAAGTSQFSDVTCAIPVEEQQIQLPSDGHLAKVEILLQKNQASHLLNQLQELIAKKSFQCSHII
jgi:hypothetical protein